MEKAGEIYLSLNLNFKNFAEIFSGISILQQNRGYSKNNECQTQ